MSIQRAVSSSARFQLQSRTSLGPAIVTLGAVALFVGAYGLGTVAENDPGAELGQLVLAIPLVGGCALLAARRPVWAITAMLGIAAFSGTLNSNFHGIPVRPLIWLLLLGLAVATAIAFMPPGRSRAAAIWPGVGALGAYLVFTALQIPFAETAHIGTQAFIAAPALILVFFAVAYSPWNGSIRWHVTRAFVLLAIVIGIYALFRLLVGPTEAEASLARRSAGVDGELALFASFGNRVQLGAWGAVAVPFLFSLALALRGRWRWFSSAALAVTVIALLGSELRTAVVGAVAGLAFALLLYQCGRAFRNFRLGVTILAVFGIAIASMVGFALTVGSDSASTSRFERIFSPGEDYSVQQRSRKWEEALAEINAHPYGQGLGTAGSTQSRYSRVLRLDNRHIDNSWLQLGVQQGYPGLILFGMSLVLILYALARASITTTDPLRSGIGIGAASALFAWLITLMTGNIPETWSALLIWVLVGLAVNGFVWSGTGRGDPAPLR